MKVNKQYIFYFLDNEQKVVSNKIINTIQLFSQKLNVRQRLN